ncbi:phospholipase C type enzyme [Rhizopus stolonifer]|uniref:Phospholipase C type enzyme n=1 Tax=Rhizopus stolonifer TaxID=4846 RepID=A0A367K3R5_RHIST|nr:phospholipase C type enzyme [Rhizopus stolonifer]
MPYSICQDYDLITLQEVWVQTDFQRIRHAVKDTLPHSKYFYSGVLGSGLAILSKFPILSTQYHRYHLNGKPLMFIHGDYYVGKGVGSIVVDHPTVGLLEVFNTHLHASYSPRHQYNAHRAAECWQLATLLRNSAAMGRQIVMSGDFNSVPTSINYQLICDHGCMTDSWLELHGEPDPTKFDVDTMTQEAYTQYFGYTCNSPFNTFSRYYQSDIHTASAKRLDYIFYRHTPQLKCIASNVVFTNLIPDSNQSYSDHFGVMSIFQLSLHADLSNLNKTQLKLSTVDAILEELRKEQTYAKYQSRLLLYACLVCLVLQMVLYIINIVLPTTLSQHGSLPIVLVTVVVGLLMNIVSVLLPVCLIVGFVFGHTEQRTLSQFIDEIETFRYQLEKAPVLLIK